MAGRRRNGEGTYGTRTIKGKKYYFFRLTDERRTTIYAKTEKELREKVKDREKKGVLENKPDYKTFGDYIMYVWLPSKKKKIDVTTYDSYEEQLGYTLINYKDYDLANTQLQNIKPEILQKYLDALAENYSHSTIVRTWGLIKQCLQYGKIKKDISIDMDEILQLVNVPIESACAVPKKEIPFLPEDDLDRLYNVKDMSDYGMNSRAVIFIGYTGLRVSECIGLKWDKVNFDEGYITIKTSAAKVKDRVNGGKKKIDKSPKNKTSERKIPLPERAIEMIQYADEAFPFHTKDDYVFRGKTGNRLDKDNINRTLKSMAKRANCKEQDFAIHSLRHTYGSILLKKGVDIKTVSLLLGHSNITTTYNIYIGILEDDKKLDVMRAFNK